MQFVKYLRLILARSIARAGSRIVQDRITLDYSLLVSVFKNCSACAFCPHKQLSLSQTLVNNYIRISLH